MTQETLIQTTTALHADQALGVPALHFEYRDVNTLKPYSNNPRQNDHTVPMLMESIRQYGFLIPILADDKGVIVSGHTRYKAAVALGMTSVPTLEVGDLSEAQINAFRLVDNKISESSKWDFDKLANEIGVLVESGVDLTQVGWSQAEIDCLVDVVGDDGLFDQEPDGVNVPHVHRSGHVSGAINDDVIPSVVIIRIGDIKLPVDQAEFEKWSHDLRKQCGFNAEKMVGEVADRLGVKVIDQNDLINLDFSEEAK